MADDCRAAAFYISGYSPGRLNRRRAGPPPSAAGDGRQLCCIWTSAYCSMSEAVSTARTLAIARPRSARISRGGHRLARPKRAVPNIKTLWIGGPGPRPVSAGQAEPGTSSSGEKRLFSSAWHATSGLLRLQSAPWPAVPRPPGRSGRGPGGRCGRQGLDSSNGTRWSRARAVTAWSSSQMRSSPKEAR